MVRSIVTAPREHCRCAHSPWLKPLAHSIALLCLAFVSVDASKAAGSAWGWGLNSSYQLCDGTNVDRHEPVEMGDLGRKVTALAGGANHTLALKSDGTVWACGSGQAVGHGLDSPASSPVQVLDSVVAIAAGAGHSLALKKDGTVWIWGTGSVVGTQYIQPVPKQVQHPDGRAFGDVATIGAGERHSLAIDIYGTVWAWGSNDHGQLGDGTTEPRFNPVKVKQPNVRPPFVQLTHVVGGSDHSLAIRADGTVWAWGWAFPGALGNGGELGAEIRFTTVRTVPVKVNTLTNARQIGAGFIKSVALQGDAIWVWGDQRPAPEISTTPVQLNSPTGVNMIAVGAVHILASLRDGTVRSWGLNNFGVLGNGNVDDQIEPVAVRNLRDVTGIAAGQFHSLAIVTPPTAVVDICQQLEWQCGPEPQLDPGLLTLQCDRPSCRVIDRMPKNCATKFDCPGCVAGGLCPPIYSVSLNGLRDAWKVSLHDADGKQMVHRQTATRKGLVVRFRPGKERFVNGSIGDYALVFHMTEKGRVGEKYKVRAGLKVDHGLSKKKR